MTYKYKSGAFTKLSKITSHSLGIPTSWVQENYNYKFYSSKKGIDVELNGYNVVGVAIKGQAIGAKINDTVTFKYELGGNKRIAEY